MIRIGCVNLDTSHPAACAGQLVKGDRARDAAVDNDGFRTGAPGGGQPFQVVVTTTRTRTAFRVDTQHVYAALLDESCAVIARAYAAQRRAG